MKPIRTTCAYCGVGCGIVVQLTGARSVQLKGDTDHPANFGKLCSKGTHLGETVGLEGRLLHPMIGDSRASWDDALDLVAGRMRACIDEHGPDSVAFYVSGQLLTEDYYVANKLMKGFIGSGNIDTNSRLCMASAVAAHVRAFDEDIVPCTYDDIDCADLIVLVGSNTAWCHPVVWQRIERARERRGTKLVVIDPRRTETAELADLHIPVSPDGDIALFNAMLAAMHDRGKLDTPFLATDCKVPDGFWDRLEREPGIEPALFQRLMRLVVQNERMLTLFSQGVNQSVCGTDKGNAIINFHLATGRINHHGAGPFSLTGQPNAMGGREVGGLANMLACHLGFEEEARGAVAQFWEAPNICDGPGLKAVDLFRAVHDGRVKFLWVMATNPAVSMPESGFVREALERCETVVVSDIMADTDTGRLADIRLPALGWGEKDGTVTNSERMVSRQRAFFRSPGEARPDWQIICDVAARLGHDDQFNFDGPAAIFREYAAMTGLAADHGKLLDLTGYAGISAEDYDGLEPFRWGGVHPLKDRAGATGRPLHIVEVHSPEIRRADPGHGLRLNTGRYRDQWHTMTRTGLSPKLAHHRREPLVEIRAGDAARMGIEDGGLATVSTNSGESIFRVAVTDGQGAGTIFTPMHWNETTASGGQSNRLAQGRADPVSGQPGFKDTPATIAPYLPQWRAFLLSRDVISPDCTYWVRARVNGGWLYELAGDGALDAHALLPQGQRSEVADVSRGMMRAIVQNDDGGLVAMLYATRKGVLPEREWVIAQFDAADPDPDPTEILAGRPSTPQPDRGKLVCLCFDVGENAIAEAVRGGAGSVSEVSACTRAGTNCGSCRPLISRLIEEFGTQMSEAAE